MQVKVDVPIVGGGERLWGLSGEALVAYSSEGSRAARIPDITSRDDFTLLAGTPLGVWAEARGILLRVT